MQLDIGFSVHHSDSACVYFPTPALLHAGAYNMPRQMLVFMLALLASNVVLGQLDVQGKAKEGERYARLFNPDHRQALLHHISSPLCAA